MNDVKEAVANWLNVQADIFRNQFKYKTLEIDDFKVSSIALPNAVETGNNTHNHGVHLSDVREVAKILDLEVKHFDRNSEEYPVELQFVWDGVVFFSIYKEEDLNGSDDACGEI